jgi:hypothetical protein
MIIFLLFELSNIPKKTIKIHLVLNIFHLASTNTTWKIQLRLIKDPRHKKIKFKIKVKNKIAKNKITKIYKKRSIEKDIMKLS